AQSHMEIGVYDCRDILRMEAPPGADRFVPAASGMKGGMFAVDDELPRPSSKGVQIPPAQTSLEGGGLGPGGPADAHHATHEPVSFHDLRARRLMKIITTNVDPPTWTDSGGPGSVTEYNG